MITQVNTQGEHSKYPCNFAIVGSIQQSLLSTKLIKATSNPQFAEVSRRTVTSQQLCQLSTFPLPQSTDYQQHSGAEYQCHKQQPGSNNLYLQFTIDL